MSRFAWTSNTTLTVTALSLVAMRGRQTLYVDASGNAYIEADGDLQATGGSVDAALARGYWVIADDASDPEEKVRRVRTQDGARVFGQPIGSIIVTDAVRAWVKKTGTIRDLEPGDMMSGVGKSRVIRRIDDDKYKGRMREIEFEDGTKLVLAPRGKADFMRRDITPEAPTPTPTPDTPVVNASTPDLADWDEAMKARETSYSNGTKEYFSFGYRRINGHLRGLKKDDYAHEIKSYTAEIDADIKKSVPLDESMTVFRGIGAKELARMLRAKDGVVKDKGYVSTTPDKTLADVYAAQSDSTTVVQVRLPAGTRALWRDVPLMWKDHDREREMLLPRNSSFRIVSTDPTVLELIL